MHKTLIVTLVFIVQGCNGADEQFEKIINSPSEFHDQEVEVTGVIHGQFMDSLIYLTNGRGQAIRVNFGDIFKLLNTVEGLDGKKIRVRGRFNKNNKGHLGQYAGSLDDAVFIMD